MRVLRLAWMAALAPALWAQAANVNDLLAGAAQADRNRRLSRHGTPGSDRWHPARASISRSPSRRTGSPACCACGSISGNRRPSAGTCGNTFFWRCVPTATTRFASRIPATRRRAFCHLKNGAFTRSGRVSTTRIFSSSSISGPAKPRRAKQSSARAIATW